jgi:hypothetical protein
MLEAQERSALRRLYSTFAGGWPGVGLLLMRVVVGLSLIVRASAMLWSEPPIGTTIMFGFSAACGILIVPGLWTPVVGTSLALIEACQFLTLPGDRWVALLLGTIGGALAMLGPGLWSVDARLFGWKRVEAPPRKSDFESA